MSEKPRKKTIATEKIKRVFERVQKGEPVSVAMVKEGYSKATAHSPHKVTTTKGWERLVRKYLPDSLLAKKHHDLLTVPKIVTVSSKDGIITKEETLDVNAIKAGLDMGYKVKGKYKPDNDQKKPEVNIINVTRAREIDQALDDM